MAEVSASEAIRLHGQLLRDKGYSEEAVAVFRKAMLPRWKPGLTGQEFDAVWQHCFKEAFNYAYAHEALLGKWPEVEHGNVWVNDIARQSGMYIVGEQGTGKSSLLESLIIADIYKGFPVIVIDPHGDLITRVYQRIPDNRLKDLSLLFMEIEDTPFGVNAFSGKKPQTSIEEAQTVDRVMHIFSVVWGEELLTQRDLPRYLRLATLVMLANPGSTLVDMYYFLRDDQDQLRQRMLKNVTNLDVRQFWEKYSSMSPSARRREIEPLLYRLEAMFLGRSLVRNIVGQPLTTIDFRKAIEHNEIILIKLPLKTLAEDAKLVGTLLVAHIRDAIFSFTDTPQERRPSYSIFIDEFQNFISADIKEIFAEGRKFGVRLCVAHQRPDQLPKDVFSAVLSARTKICFRVTEAAGQLAPLFIQKATRVQKEDIDPHPVRYLLTYGHEHAAVARFIDLYLRPVSLRPKRFEVSSWEATYDVPHMATDFVLNTFGYTTQWPPDRPIVDNPIPYLDPFLYQVQVEQNPTLPIPIDVVAGFSDSGIGYYKLLDEKLKSEVLFALLETKDPSRYSGKLPGKREQADLLIDLLASLRAVMGVLATDPIGEKRTDTLTEVTQKIIHLPNREALVSTGENVFHMRTHDTPAPESNPERSKLLSSVVDNLTKYLRSKKRVEQYIQARLEVKEDEETEAKDTSSNTAKVEVEPLKTSEPKTQSPEAPAPQAPERQTLTPATVSTDTMNILYTQLRAREVDPDTPILAALGEHYVMTIKQWMRLFEWGSYPRATQYFKELREEGQIFRKDREGRGGTLVSGDWFFLLTKGANELMKRKQSPPSFTLEPNEAEKASGDTLFHTYLVNEVLIHLRLLERQNPDLLKIERIDHERSIRRKYLAALGADVKLYPDGFLRLLMPTPNGLKRRYMFFELQHTTQRDEANWKAKCRKYLALFEQETVLEKFFATRAPSVLVITVDPSFVPYHKRWTEEVLQESGAKGREFSSRFIIGSFDTGISEMSVTPQQYFCEPRFFAPFQNAARALFGA